MTFKLISLPDRSQMKPVRNREENGTFAFVMYHFGQKLEAPTGKWSIKRFGGGGGETV